MPDPGLLQDPIAPRWWEDHSLASRLPPSQQLKILFVEDEPGIRTIVALALGRDSDFSLTTYASGVEALKDIERSSHSFDFALLNMRLPSMAGIEFEPQSARTTCKHRTGKFSS
ncbi:response regulator [Sphingobium indicum]|uniref:response regulator n=1 Tax=Sphingobium indicum TaxID=332055 RepID=UPI0009DAB767